MALTETDGATTTDGSEQTLWDVTGLNHYAGWLYLHNMTSTETLVVKIYVYDSEKTTYRIWDTWTYTGAQAHPAVFIPYISSARFKVTMQLTAGTNKEISWAYHNA